MLVGESSPGQPAEPANVSEGELGSNPSPSIRREIAPHKSEQTPSHTGPLLFVRNYLGLSQSEFWIILGILLAAVIEASVLIGIQWVNYSSFQTSQGDLGNYNQAFWTTVHGQGFFYYTTNIPSGTGGNLFAVHFSPFLILLLPFYAIAPGPMALVAIKQVALALGALPLYGIARTYFKRRTLPMVFVVLYLLSPLTLALDWNNFDPEAFIPVTLLTALYFFVRGRQWCFIAAWILTLSTIEAIPAVLMLFAAGGLIGTLFSAPLSPWLSRSQERRFLLTALVISVAWLGLAYLALRAISPLAGAFGDNYEARYTLLGASSFLTVLPQAIAHPALAGAAFHYEESQKLLFVGVLILASGAFFVLGGLRYWLPFVGYLVLALLSNVTIMYIFGAQYPAYISAILFVGAIEGVVFTMDRLGGSSYGSRRADLIRRLEAEIRDLAGSLERLEGHPARREQAFGLLRDAASALGEGNLSKATHEIRLTRAIFSDVTNHSREDSITSGIVFPVSLLPTPAASTPTAPRKGLINTVSPGILEVACSVVVIVCLLFATGFASPLLSSPAAGGYKIAYGENPPNGYDDAIQSVLRLIPESASVLTTNHIFPQVSNRPNAFILPNSGFIWGSETYSEALNHWVNLSDYVLIDYSVDATISVITRALANLSSFGVYAAVNQAYLYERGWIGPPALFVPSDTSYAGGSLSPTQGNFVSHAVESTFGASLYHPAGGSDSEQLWSGPNALYVPPGRYNVTFVFEIESPTHTPSLQLSVKAKPANVTDEPFAQSSIGSHHLVSLSPDRSVAANILGSYNYTHYSSTLVPESATIEINWTGTGYLSFLGFEKSTQMSMYLLGISLIQLSALP